MQYTTFRVPLLNAEPFLDDLNRFLRLNRVMSVDRQFVQAGAESCWAFCVAHAPAAATAEAPFVRSAAGKVDYQQVLSPADFNLYAQLRALRREIAVREGVPAYALFTNDQLAEIVRRRIGSPNEVASIAGVGPARAEKYGEQFVEALRVALGGVIDPSSSPSAPSPPAPKG